MKLPIFEYTLLALITISTSINAAEVIVNGVAVKSEIETKEFPCDGYSILIRTDRFPAELEGEMEKTKIQSFQVFLEIPTIVGARASVKKDGIEYEIPDVTKKYQRSGKLLNDGRIYLPSLGYCLNKTTFVMYVWSGGNCTQCEGFIRY